MRVLRFQGYFVILIGKISSINSILLYFTVLLGGTNFLYNECQKHLTVSLLLQSFSVFCELFVAQIGHVDYVYGAVVL